MTNSFGHKIFCLVGPSGTGKDTIKKNLKLPYVISHRTREKRKGEKEGIDGYWITVEEFLLGLENNRWIAHTKYAGNYYGIDQGELFPIEYSPMTYVVDYPGVVRLKEALNNISGYSSEQVVSIYIKGTKNDLEKRMIRQGRTAKEIQTRLLQYDYDIEVESMCDYIVINENGKLDRTIKEIYEIILKEEGVIKDEENHFFLR